MTTQQSSIQSESQSSFIKKYMQKATATLKPYSNKNTILLLVAACAATAFAYYKRNAITNMLKPFILPVVNCAVSHQAIIFSALHALKLTCIAGIGILIAVKLAIMGYSYVKEHSDL